MKRTCTHLAVAAALLSFAGCTKEDLQENYLETGQSVMIRSELIETGADKRIALTIGAQTFTALKGHADKGIYSFSLLKPDGSSRLTGVQYSLQDGPWTPVTFTFREGCSDSTVLQEEFQLQAKFGTLQEYLKAGQIGDILASDLIRKNNGACGNADIAQASIPVNADCTRGCLIILKVRAYVDGNEGYNVFPFSIEIY